MYTETSKGQQWKVLRAVILAQNVSKPQTFTDPIAKEHLINNVSVVFQTSSILVK